MKKHSMNIDIQGALDLIRKSRYPLAPVYEALTNSIEAIAQKHVASPFHGEISLHFSFGGLLNETKELRDIVITDNGVGFTEEHFNRFLVLLDKSKGFNNRGSGRLQFLHRFAKVSIESVFCTGQEYFLRSFECSNQRFGENPKLVQIAQRDTGTKLVLSSFMNSPEELGFFDNLTVGDIVADIKKKFLLRFYLDAVKPDYAVPTIQISVSQNDKIVAETKISPEELPQPIKTGTTKVSYVKLNEHVQDKLEWQPIPDQFEILHWAHFRLPGDDLDHHGVYLCSKDIPVERLNFEELKKGDCIDGYRFLTSIYGEVLDKEQNVSHAVDSFTFPSKKHTERAVREDLLFNASEQFLFLDDIEEEVHKLVPDLYADVLEKNKVLEQDIAAIAAAHGIPLETAMSANIKLTDTKKTITDKIYKKQAEKLSEQNSKIIHVFEDLKKLDPTSQGYPEALKDKCSELLTLIPEQNKEELSRYIIRREMISDVLKKILAGALDYQQDKSRRKDREGLIHDLIFKRKTHTSDGLNDLWVLNEEFVHYSGCSDMRIDQISDAEQVPLLQDIPLETIKEFGLKLDRRPDIFLFAEEGKCVLVELKEPNVDLSDHLNQLGKYCTLIANFSKIKIDQFFCYLIGEKINPLTDLPAEYEETTAGDWIRTGIPIRSVRNADERMKIASYQMEIIKLSSLYRRSHMRNKSFAEKLGISLTTSEN